MLNSIFSKKTNFVGGGLIKSEIPLSGPNVCLSTQKFVAPRKIDNRDMCLMSSNQGQTPHCAGYSTAGYIEFQNWKMLHYPEQVNGDSIYVEAKKYDGFTDEGTTLIAAAQGAIALGLIKGEGKHIPPDRTNIQFALHKYGVCTAGFMIDECWNRTSNGRIVELRNARGLGGHAVLLCGYDSEGVYIQNSWGEIWGLHGFAVLPWNLFDKQIMSGLVIDG